MWSVMLASLLPLSGHRLTLLDEMMPDKDPARFEARHGRAAEDGQARHRGPRAGLPLVSAKGASDGLRMLDPDGS